MKKVEIEAAAAAWSSPTDSADSDESSEQTDVAEEQAEEAPSELDGESEVEEAQLKMLQQKKFHQRKLNLRPQKPKFVRFVVTQILQVQSLANLVDLPSD